ncbi:MAG: FAD-dependent oxidoreductase [Prosthecobacter sp.]
MKSFLLVLALITSARAAEVIESDLCVYGGTSGGVAAAVQGARMGKNVVIAEPGKHLGGMTSGGLSAVDIGDPRSVGGIAREYFTKLAATVGVTLAWDKVFKSAGGGPATGGAYAIEPHKAEEVFTNMAREAGVKVHFKARIASVKKDGARIVEIVTEDGTAFRAKMFIDATYEGDLMARAGVGFTLMREGNARYGETYNGIHYTDKYLPRTSHQKPASHGRVPGGQGVWDRDFPLDPYLIKGDPKSGLLPLINAGEPGKQGEPAPGVQAYCFRLCLTTNPANMIPITPPADYDPKRYEIIARFIEACLAIGDDMDLRWFSKHDPLPNDKWDFNTATFGGNLPGASHAWPEADHAQREKIAKEHENYHRGLLHFLATDPRVPEKVRKDMRRYGLPKDEFKDNGGWPHQIYVREARRMVSDLVITEHHTFGRQTAPKSISLGSYGTDTHEIRRIVKDGVVAREGKTATGRDGAPPYAIGYDAIVPKQAECENLFVTFALSASHPAFSSIRMEPVFMCSSQSAATAAVLAMDEQIPVQKVDYTKLKARLEKDGQILEWKFKGEPEKKGAH